MLRIVPIATKYPANTVTDSGIIGIVVDLFMRFEATERDTIEAVDQTRIPSRLLSFVLSFFLFSFFAIVE